MCLVSPGEHVEQITDLIKHSGTRVPQGVPGVKVRPRSACAPGIKLILLLYTYAWWVLTYGCVAQAAAAPQSLPCSRTVLTASPTPFTVLSASANAVPTPLEYFSTPNATLPKPPVDDFPAVPGVLMPHPWGLLLPVAEDAAAVPCQDPALLLHERVSEERVVSGKKSRRHGVLSLLKDVCKSLMGTRSVAPLPPAEELAVPVSRLEDDTPLVAWRQEYYVQSRLQHSPQLTVGEARVRPIFTSIAAAQRHNVLAQHLGPSLLVTTDLRCKLHLCFLRETLLPGRWSLHKQQQFSLFWLVDACGGYMLIRVR